MTPSAIPQAQHQHRDMTRLLGNGLFTFVASAVLLLILLCFGLVWPLTHSGIQCDRSTFQIHHILPNSPADHTGLRVGDYVTRLYQRPIQEVSHHLDCEDLFTYRNTSVPIAISRAGQVITHTMQIGEPSAEQQAEKVAITVLALLCWFTGYLLGVVRRHDGLGSRVVAFFWFLLAAVVGSLQIALTLELPVLVFLEWIMIGLVTPLALYVHIWFPPRSIPAVTLHRARRYLIAGLIGTNSIIGILWMLAAFSLMRFLSLLIWLMPLALSIALFGSAAILRRAYTTTTIAHARRQIRLISSACVITACIWLLLKVLPLVLTGTYLVNTLWFDYVCGLVPLAYLIGGIAPDLYRLNRLVLRTLIHIVTITLLVSMLAAITTLFALQDTVAAAWIAVCSVVLYRPIQRLGLRLLPVSLRPTHSVYQALHQAAASLTTTLDTTSLVNALSTGVRTAFSDPAYAFYQGALNESNMLTLSVQERLPGLPNVIVPNALTSQLCRCATITESRDLCAALTQHALNTTDEQTVRHPGIVLWCPIRHTHGHLLGVLLLGMRGDLDPYRLEDLEELKRLLYAAALAFRNSAAYMQQREAQATIRQLYERLQQTQQDTAAAIARELHDEILNVNLRLNIESLQTLLAEEQDPHHRAELELILEGQQAMSQIIRLICEDLHHTGIDDPLGLPALLRQLVSQIQANWFGQCHLVIEGTPCTVAAFTQREALGIVREAMTNAVKHASATAIVVTLCYPQTRDEPVQLIIRDNGQNGQLVVAKPGHLGVQGMYERARAVGGTLQFHQEADGGVAVVFTFTAQDAPVVL